MGIMDGKRVLVTGGTSGVGYYTALELARLGASVTILGRNLAKCQASVQSIQQESGNPHVSYLQADFSSLDQVGCLAQDFLDQNSQLDVLVNNAGTAYLFRKLSADGLELTFAVNYLSHFLLTSLLLPALRTSPSARVINVSSGGHSNQHLDFNDLQTARFYNPYKAYGRSKLANILFSYELARRLSGTHITSNALTPGMVATEIWKKVHPWLTPLLFPIIRHYGQTPLEGAETSIYLASSSEVEGLSGLYYANKRPIRSSPASYDQATARRLWEVSRQLAGLDG
jgi:NAD(P)-dependent dehydrogenase (short-subunit alcohol dehydrogenase family)